MTRVMLLGTPHFMEFDPQFIFSKGFQGGIDGLVRRLSVYAPDKLILEADWENRDELNEAYRTLVIADFDDVRRMESRILGQMTMRGNRYPITFNNEGVQIGFRLAKLLGHESVHAMDYDLLHPFDFDIYAVADGIPGRNRVADQYRLARQEEERLSGAGDICGLLRFINRPDIVRICHHHDYLSLVALGAGNGYAGSDHYLKWYERNIKSFANLQTICEDCERVIVLCGAGHLGIYQDLIGACMDMEPVDPTPYL